MNSDEITYIRQVVENQAGQECGLSATFAMLKGLLATMDMLRQLLDRTAAPQDAPDEYMCKERHDCGGVGLLCPCQNYEAERDTTFPHTPPATSTVPPSSEVVEALRELVAAMRNDEAFVGEEVDRLNSALQEAERVLASLDAGETPAPDYPAPRPVEDAARMAEVLRDWFKSKGMGNTARIADGLIALTEFARTETLE
jgi:hypothetical protein